MNWLLITRAALGNISRSGGIFALHIFFWRTPNFGNTDFNLATYAQGNEYIIWVFSCVRVSVLVRERVCVRVSVRESTYTGLDRPPNSRSG